MDATHYDILGVTTAASEMDIEYAYLGILAATHTYEDAGIDVGLDGDLTRVIEAYTVLHDPALRAAYDAALRQQTFAENAAESVLALSRQMDLLEAAAAAESAEWPKYQGRGPGWVRSLVATWIVVGVGTAVSVSADQGVRGIAGALVAAWVAMTVLATVALMRVAQRSPAAIAAYGVAVVLQAAVLVATFGLLDWPARVLGMLWIALYVGASELAAAENPL